MNVFTIYQPYEKWESDLIKRHMDSLFRTYYKVFNLSNNVLYFFTFIYKPTNLSDLLFTVACSLDVTELKKIHLRAFYCLLLFKKDKRIAYLSII